MIRINQLRWSSPHPRVTPKGIIDGKDFPPIRYSRVYVKRSGHWQVMLQMTRIAESSTQ